MPKFDEFASYQNEQRPKQRQIISPELELINAMLINASLSHSQQQLLDLIQKFPLKMIIDSQPQQHSLPPSPAPHPPQQHRLLNRTTSEPTPKSPVITPGSARYKTELCRSFEESANCKYGEKCQYAHGAAEMRSLNRHPKYKTELCREFHGQRNMCPYGTRCNFIHDQVPGEVEETFFRQKSASIGSYNSGGSSNSVSPNTVCGDEVTTAFPFDLHAMKIGPYIGRPILSPQAVYGGEQYQLGNPPYDNGRSSVLARLSKSP